MNNQSAENETASFKFPCPHCSQRLEAEIGWVGMELECPNCNRTITVPENPIGSAASVCPGCASLLSKGAVICVQCGYDTRSGKRVATNEDTPIGLLSRKQTLDEQSRRSLVTEPTVGITEETERSEGINKKPPSPFLGYLISGLITFILLIPLLTIFIMAFVGKKYIAVVYIVGFIVFFGIAEAINKKRRHKTKMGANVTARGHGYTSPVQAQASNYLIDENAAGHIENGRFVINRDELTRIIVRPDTFSNVVAVREHSIANSAKQGIWAPQWFFVFSRNSAIFINGDASEVWTVRPEDVVYNKLFQWHVRSVEGKTENIAFFPPRDVAWILAWKSRSWDDFSRLTAIMRGKGYIVSPWTLLVLSAETGHGPSGWLSFELPYRSIQDGFVNLCRLQDEMEIVVKGSESMSVFKWASKLDCQTKEMIFSAVKRHLIRKGRKFMSVGIVMSLIGISTGTLILTHNRDRDLVILAFVCGGLFVIGGGILIAAAVHQFSLRSKLDRSL